jgi:hypothetical protein
VTRPRPSSLARPSCYGPIGRCGGSGHRIPLAPGIMPISSPVQLSNHNSDTRTREWSTLGGGQRDADQRMAWVVLALDHSNNEDLAARPHRQVSAIHVWLNQIEK